MDNGEEGCPGPTPGVS